MCGIVGFLDKTKNENTDLGNTILRMLSALDCRGPDSAGVALYGNPRNGDMVVQVKLGEGGVFEEKRKIIGERIGAFGNPREFFQTAEYLRFVIDYQDDISQIVECIEAVDNDVEVVSMGSKLEIIKQVGSPKNLDKTYGISEFIGSHGIGHTRMSTESIVDLSHSQPFWAHGYPDLAIVHNGHITNYHKMRRRYEQHQVKFYTENDSEIIGIYLGERLSRGMTLREALDASLIDLDGSFSYLVSTPDTLAFVKDPFAFKPLLFCETDDFVAISNEEIAIRSAFEGDYEVREAQAKEVRVWQR